MNDDLKINKENALKRAESILINNKDYSFSKVYFIFDEKLYTYKIQEATINCCLRDARPARLTLSIYKKFIK